jgi:maltooligosyltrehalose trehalohydrolase
MGEEYGETAPFPYFTSHTDPGLIEAVRRGRRAEFAAFQWDSEPPDPQDEATFLQAKLQHGLRTQGKHGVLYTFYRTLLNLRTNLAALATLRKDLMEVSSQDQVLCVRRWCQDAAVLLLLHFGTTPLTCALPIPAGTWQKRLDSAARQWQGPGSTLPASLDSTGEARLTLPPTMAVLFVRT